MAKARGKTSGADRPKAKRKGATPRPAKTSGVPLSYADKSGRNVVHLRLPEVIRVGIRARAEVHNQDYFEEWDKASLWFLAHPPPAGVRLYEHFSKSESWKTVWIRSDLYQRLKELAERDEVSLSRVIHTLGARYLRETKD